MIVYWNRYQKNEKEIQSKATERKQDNESFSSLFNRVIKESKSPDLRVEENSFALQTSITLTSNFLSNGLKKPNRIDDLGISSISSYCPQNHQQIDSITDIGRSNIFILNDLELLFNSDAINSTSLKPSECFLIKHFGKAIGNQYLFDCLMTIFYSNPPLFFHNYFEHILLYAPEIILSHISYPLLVESFAYFTPDQLKTFTSKVIQKYFNDIIKNKYAIIVLRQFVINCLSIDESVLMSLIKLICLNFSHIITDENSSKIIHTLLNVNNPFISDKIVEAIGKNSISTALSPNGVHITTTFMHCPVLRQLIVHRLLENINVILIHQNGHQVIELLLNMKISSITVFVINSLLSNISFISNADYYLNLIEKSIMSLDTVSVAQLHEALNDPFLLNFLTKSNIGIRIMNNTQAIKIQANSASR